MEKLEGGKHTTEEGIMEYYMSFLVSALEKKNKTNNRVTLRGRIMTSSVMQRCALKPVCPEIETGTTGLERE